MEDIKAKVETTETTHNDFNRAIIAIGFLVICILALTYGEYKMGKALDKAFSERQMLLDRIEVLEKNVSELASQSITTGIDKGEEFSPVDDVDNGNVSATVGEAKSVVGSAVGAVADVMRAVDKTVE